MVMAQKSICGVSSSPQYKKGYDEFRSMIK